MLQPAEKVAELVVAVNALELVEDGGRRPPEGAQRVHARDGRQQQARLLGDHL